jgi:photosystem II stability/assembly factor-like uncharacterized protein
MKSIVIMFFSIVFVSSLIFSQQINWNHTGGPMGGVIGGMDINSNGDIYAGVYPFGGNYTGLYRSSDNGENWYKIETQFEDFEVFSVFITKEDHIWVGTDYQGVLYRSTNNGQTWENKANGYTAFECWAIGESNTGILIAGDANSGHLYRSTDSGENWEYSANIAPLAFAVDTNNIVYAGSFNGLYASADNGVTWVHNSFLSGFTIPTVMIDIKNNIFCGTGYSFVGGDGVFYSEDAGVNWIQLGLAGKAVLSLAFDSGGSLYAGTLNDGLFKTSDMGQTWYQYQNGIYRKEVYRLKINQEDDIFIGSEGGGNGWQFYGGGGVFRSKNGGDSFEQVGLPMSLVKNIVFSGDSLIITSTPSGVQKYNRVAKKWKNSGLHNVEAVSITPSNYLYAATSDEGLFISTDLGENWLLTNLTADTLMPVYNVIAITDDTLFASTGFQMNLRRSADGGQNWDVLPIRTGETSRGLLFNNDMLFITGFESGTSVLYTTNNFGFSIDSLYSGFDTQGVNNPLSATNNGYVFLASRGDGLFGVARSQDNGLSWAQVLFINNTKPTVFADNNGIVITGTTVFSFSDTNKIYISTDFGDTWSGINQPTKWGTSVTDIKQDLQGNYFFGTSGEGLFEVDIITRVEEEPYHIYNYSLLQNYPNPFNPITHLKYSIPQSGMVTLKVYDILGREKAILVEKFQDSGEYDVEFNPASGNQHLASGIYLYQLKAGNFIQTKKMLLLK